MIAPLYPITLTADEYQALVLQIAARDPVLRLLMSKQEAAAQTAAAPTQPEPRSPAYEYAFGKAAE